MLINLTPSSFCFISKYKSNPPLLKERGIAEIFRLIRKDEGSEVI